MGLINVSVMLKRGHVLFKKRVETIDEYIQDLRGKVQYILEIIADEEIHIENCQDSVNIMK